MSLAMTDLSAFSPENPLVLAGCGNMGGALLNGWLRSGLSRDAVIIVDPVMANAGSAPAGVACYANVADLGSTLSPAMVMLAVKPQVMADVAAGYVDMVNRSNAAVISIAAGVGMDSYQGWFGPSTPLIRVMPNTPSAVGAGMSLLFKNAAVGDDLATLGEVMLSAVGECIWVRQEAQIDALVGVTGSGPAYVFLLIECIAAAAEKTGLNPDDAKLAARQTVYGAALLADQQPEIDAAELRRRVTSPGGVTQAALDVLMAPERGLPDLFPEAMARGERRNAELSGKA